MNADDIPLDPEASKIRLLFLNKIEDTMLGFVETVRHSKSIFELLTFTRLELDFEEIIHQARDFLATMNIKIPPVA